jgi:Glycosyl hydrolase family 20, domain 2/Concanavalin A-like lectin/glucanases superfamily
MKRSPLLKTAALLWIVSLFLFSCGPGDTGNDESRSPKITLHESFDSVSAMQSHGAILNGEGSSALIPGIDGTGFWLGAGSFVTYPAKGKIHPEHGTVEFWVCPKSRWNDGTLKHLLTIGDRESFSLVKGENDDLELTLHGKTIGFYVDNSMLGEHPPYQWRSGWNHVAITWRELDTDDNGELVLMVNGVVRNYMVDELPRIGLDSPIVLGGITAGTEPNAIFDELKIYNYHRPYTDFLNVTSGLQLDPPKQLQIYPQPHAAGLLSDEEFFLTSETKLVVAGSENGALLEALDRFNDRIDAAFGFRLEVTTVEGYVDGAPFIAVGTIASNGLLKSLASSRKIPATVSNPGPHGYILEVFPDGIAVAGSDYSGAVKGLLSLAMLLEQHYDRRVMHYLLVDYPDMPFRATVIRDGDSLTEELADRLVYFAAMGLSHLVVDSSAYFDLDDPVVAARIDEVFTFARNLGMEPVPLVNGYSNSERLIEICTEEGVDCSEGQNKTHYCPCEPHVYDVMRRTLENTIDLLDPAMIHLGHDNIKAFNQDPRCAPFNWSPAEIYVKDIERIRAIITELNPEIDILIWYDMINSMHHGGRLAESKPNGEPSPAIGDIAPKDVIWCPYGNASIDPLLGFIYPLITFMGLEAELWGRYTGGPTGRDMDGAFSWIRNGFEFGAIGFLNRPESTALLDHRSWRALPVAAELAWSYWMPPEHDQFWYDFSENNEEYGGFK